MAAISISELNNAAVDVAHISEVATSGNTTATDRVGNIKSTVKGAVDSLKAFNSRGSWVTATAYAMKDLVTSGGAWYACVTAHTSSASFATDSAKWRVHQGVTVADLADGGISAIAAGIPIPGVTASYQATRAISTHANYAFLDNSTINYSAAGFQAHASFNSNVKIEGTQNSDHHHDFQSYTHHNAAGTLSRFSSFWSQFDHTGVGTVVEASLFKANNPTGAGPIANLYGMYIAPLTRGTANYAIYVAGTTVSYFGGPLLLGQIGNPTYVMYNPNTGNLDLTPRTGYGVAVGGPILFGASTGTPAKIAYNVNGNLDITPRTGYHTSLTAGSLLVGAAIPAAGEKVNVTGATTDYIARLYNTHASAPKGIALVYSGAAPNGTGNEFLYCQDSVAIRYKVLSNGNVQNTNNSYGALSDVKLKENIIDATPKLAKLMNVRVVNYNLKSEPDDQKQIGVIAQELESVFPGMVEVSIDRDENGKDKGTITKSVKYSVFVPMLIKAMQEQQVLIADLERKYEALAAPR